MLLSEILHESVIVTGFEASSKEAAVEKLVDVLTDAHEIPLSLHDHVLETVMEREASLSTGMEHGIALPHGSSEKIDDIIGAMAVSPEGVPFETLDGLSARIILLLVLPRRNFQGRVHTLASIAHLLENPEFRTALQKATSAAEVLSLVEAEEDSNSLLDQSPH